MLIYEAIHASAAYFSFDNLFSNRVQKCTGHLNVRAIMWWDGFSILGLICQDMFLRPWKDQIIEDLKTKVRSVISTYGCQSLACQDIRRIRYLVVLLLAEFERAEENWAE
jgi:hypothetical protein